MGHLIRLLPLATTLALSMFFLPPLIKADDGSALLEFMKLADPSGSLFTLWTNPPSGDATKDDFCIWTGVKCGDNNQRVVSLILENIGLNGTILPDFFSQVDHLEILSLRQNKLKGTIPSVFLAENLTTLLLDDNELTGLIPISLETLSNLKTINLSNNKLSGSLPDSPNLNTVSIFDVANNNLSGPIPSSLSQFDKSSFQGNNDLCGKPLDRVCPSIQLKDSNQPTKSSKEGFPWMMVIYIILGVVVGMGLAIVGVLLIYKRKASQKNQNIKCSPWSDQSSRKSNFSSSEKVSRRSVDGGRKSSVSPVDKATLRLGFDGTMNKDISHMDATKNDTLTSLDVSLEGMDDKGTLEFIDVEDREFELEDLLKASAEILGRGLLGSCYKATLEGELEVVVKRLSLMNHCEKKPFVDVMKALGKMKHPNILPLRAHFYAKEEKLLIYDYVPNGSLFNALHTPEGRRQTPLDWMARIKIAKGVASAMDYIHTTYASSLTPSRSPACFHRRFMVLHGNLKSSNILLGPDSEAYVADFGMAAMLQGTPALSYMAGHRAPECRGGARKLHPLADIYSYGVMLLELLTGKMPMQGYATNNGMAPQGGVDLPSWVDSVIREEWTAEVFDRELACNKVEEDELVSLLKLAMACVSPVLDQRPSMSLILQTINQDIKSIKPPTPSNVPSSLAPHHGPYDLNYQDMLFDRHGTQLVHDQSLHHQSYNHNGHQQMPSSLDMPSSDHFSFSFEGQVSSVAAISVDSLQR